MTSPNNGQDGDFIMGVRNGILLSLPMWAGILWFCWWVVR